MTAWALRAAGAGAALVTTGYHFGDAYGRGRKVTECGRSGEGFRAGVAAANGALHDRSAEEGLKAHNREKWRR